jgi:hypothetical protein
MFITSHSNLISSTRLNFTDEEYIKIGIVRTQFFTISHRYFRIRWKYPYIVLLYSIMPNNLYYTSQLL